jgi:hypothetical protein
LCEEVPRQNAAESRKIPESGSVIPREGVESLTRLTKRYNITWTLVIPREGVESLTRLTKRYNITWTLVIPREGVESDHADAGADGEGRGLRGVIPREGVESRRSSRAWGRPRFRDPE